MGDPNTAHDELVAIASEWTDDPTKRVCALCLRQVDRQTYDQHMRAHGYTTIHLGRLVSSKVDGDRRRG